MEQEWCSLWLLPACALIPSQGGGLGLCAPAALHPKAIPRLTQELVVHGPPAAELPFPLDRSVSAERQVSSGDGGFSSCSEEMNWLKSPFLPECQWV